MVYRFTGETVTVLRENRNCIWVELAGRGRCQFWKANLSDMFALEGSHDTSQGLADAEESNSSMPQTQEQIKGSGVCPDDQLSQINRDPEKPVQSLLL